MNYSEWESALIQELKSLSTAECIKITSYYREMYGDKLDAGINEEQILSEFGSPKACAEKILAEQGTENDEVHDKGSARSVSKKNLLAGRTTKNIILTVLFSLFAGLPLAAVLAAIILALGAVCVSGAAGVLASLVYVLVGAFSATGAGIAAHIGLAIAGIGVCGLLGIGSFFATKYGAIFSYKLMKRIYGGILK